MINRYFGMQTEIVVKALMKYRKIERSRAISVWMQSKTKKLIQDEYNMEHISGARCYDELIMELDGDPYWMKGQFD